MTTHRAAPRAIAAAALIGRRMRGRVGSCGSKLQQRGTAARVPRVLFWTYGPLVLRTRAGFCFIRGCGEEIAKRIRTELGRSPPSSVHDADIQFAHLAMCQRSFRNL